ncbi:MAG: proprotein convertase P-domain-containing protein, partial [Planctomycetota bacterium]
LLLCAGGALAGEQKLPTAFTTELSPLEGIQLIKVEPVKIERELAKDAARFGESKPRRFAVPNEVDLTPENSGVWEDAGNGYAVWRLRVSADSARSINLGFTDLELPEKATLFVYDEKIGDMAGPYTSAHNNADNQLWTPVIPGEYAVIELTVPLASFHDVRLRIGSVNAAYRDFGLVQEDGTLAGVPKSGSCNLDVICGTADGFPQVDLWRGQIPAVGAYTVNGIDTCTGSMINNTAQDGRPLFLTAGHCNVQNNPGGIVVYWNYETDTCRPVNSAASGTPIPRTGFPTTSGSTLLFTTGGTISGTPDHTLLELNTDAATLALIGVTYNGWDIREQDWSSAVTIHHPGVDEKRISFEDQPLTRTDYLVTPELGTSATHWRVEDWDLGTTEPGSSGSPLYNPEMRLIGVLSGGFASCTSQTADWYGRTALAMDQTSGGNTLRSFLDPLNTGVEFLDTLGAGPIPFITAGPLSDIEASGLIGGPFVGGTGSTTISNMTEADADYTVSILPGGTAPIMLSGDTGGTLADGETATFTIFLEEADAELLGAGLYTSTVQIEDVTNAQTYTRDVVLEVGRVNYNSTDVPVAIPDLGVASSTITVTDDICIADLDVDVNISHTFSGDLILTLEGPDGTVVTLRDREGGSAANVVETYDDDGRAPTGPGLLADYNFSSTLGTWTLTVSDNAGQDIGDITGWSLGVLSTGGDCPPPADDQFVAARDAEPESITLGSVAGLTYRVTSLPTDGDLVDPSGPAVIDTVPYDLTGSLVVYVSDFGYGGPDGFTFVTDDGTLESFTATVGIGVDNSDAVASFPLDTDPGWSTEGGWQFGGPLGLGGDPGSAFTGANVYGNNLSGTYSDDIEPAEYLTTTAIDFTGITNARLRFQRWLGVETSTFDQATVEVSNDGTNWTQLFLNEGGFGNQTIDEAWSLQDFDISAIADNQPAVFVRWGLETDGSVNFAGWNIDDVAFIGDGVATEAVGACCFATTSVITTSA